MCQVPQTRTRFTQVPKSSRSAIDRGTEAARCRHQTRPSRLFRLRRIGRTAGPIQSITARRWRTMSPSSTLHPFRASTKCVVSRILRRCCSRPGRQASAYRHVARSTQWAGKGTRSRSTSNDLQLSGCASLYAVVRKCNDLSYATLCITKFPVALLGTALSSTCSTSLTCVRSPPSVMASVFPEFSCFFFDL